VSGRDVRRTEGEPHDSLTRLTKVMTDALEADPDYDKRIKVQVFLNDGTRGGIQHSGYDEDSEAIADLFVYLAQMFEASGKTLLIAPLGRG
jgi:hypothetical protein